VLSIFKFSMKGMGDADVTLNIKISRDNDGICLYKSHYIKKVLGRFNYRDCSLMATLCHPTYKLTQNSGRPITQLKYAKVIGCLIYAMISIRLVVAFVIGKLSRYTSNPSNFHWHVIR